MPTVPALPSPRSALERVRRDVERNVLRARNGIGLAADSLLPAAARVGLTPKDVVWRRGRCELWRYRGEGYRGADTAPVRPPLLIVFSLISRSYILDLSPGNSVVEQLLAAGFDVFLLDWGVPDERDARNELDDYVDGYIPAAIERVRELTAADDIHLLGYCLGGNLTLLHVAHHPDAPLRTLTVMASPADLHQVGPLGDIFRVGGMEVEAVLDADGNVPAQVVRQGFKSLAPTADVSRYVSLWERLWSDDYVAAYQAMTGWSGDHIPFPGAAARDVVAMLVRDNGMVTDRLRVGGDAVHLRDVTVPFLTVLAERDNIVPVESAAPMIDLVGSPDRHELRLPAGHIGLVVGKTAARTTIPQVIEFLRHRSDPRLMGAADMEIVELSPAHLDAVSGFLAELPDRDGTFLKDDLADPDLLRSWLHARAGRRWVAVDGGTVLGLLALLPLSGRSDHVGEVRLVVHPARRGTGLGRDLGRLALISAVDMGLSKVVVEVLADQEGALGLFAALGFTGEALLRDQIRDDDGDLRDLVVLAHHVDDVRARMDTLGLTDELRS